MRLGADVTADEKVWLHVDGSTLRDRSGREVRPRGVGLGGWLNMENFITGYPGSETFHRRALRRVLGEERYGRLFDGLLGSFFGADDAAFIASLGMNMVRIPVNYRHLQDDLDPSRILPGAFEHLDRAVRACAEQGLWTVIDLHALPGSQNHFWHSDNRFHAPLLWEHRDFQDRTVAVWEAIAEHYRDEPWVAGYNLINEPADEQVTRLVALHARLVDAIRRIDAHHILFLDGNRYAREFDGFGEPVVNAVYAVHQYPAPGSITGGPYPGTTAGHYWDEKTVRKELEGFTEYHRAHGVPGWIGEFGPVYPGDPARDAQHRALLADQLALYESEGLGWSLWTYKDIGLQGLVCADPDSPWMQRTADVRAKKDRLGIDSWGSSPEGIQDVLAPLARRFEREFPAYDPYPFGVDQHIGLLVRQILLAEPLVEEFAGALAGASDSELDALGASFAFANCRKNEALCLVISSACRPT
jgi:endoglucanase